jgi:Fe-S-cluster containining protein
MASEASPEKKPEKWWSEGVRFQCQGSGNCCVSHGEFGFVYVTKSDRQNMAKLLGMTTAAFTKKHCNKTDDFFHLKDNGEDCSFLKNKRCTIYTARPMQCRTWPFWPETMSAKSWKKEVMGFCPGVNKGPVRDATEIQTALDQQKQWEQTLAEEASQQ